jgi:hypothetical protein
MLATSFVGEEADDGFLRGRIVITSKGEIQQGRSRKYSQ